MDLVSCLANICNTLGTSEDSTQHRSGFSSLLLYDLCLLKVHIRRPRSASTDIPFCGKFWLVINERYYCVRECPEGPTGMYVRVAYVSTVITVDRVNIIL